MKKIKDKKSTTSAEEVANSKFSEQNGAVQAELQPRKEQVLRISAKSWRLWLDSERNRKNKKIEELQLLGLTHEQANSFVNSAPYPYHVCFDGAAGFSAYMRRRKTYFYLTRITQKYKEIFKDVFKDIPQEHQSEFFDMAPREMTRFLRMSPNHRSAYFNMHKDKFAFLNMSSIERTKYFELIAARIRH